MNNQRLAGLDLNLLLALSALLQHGSVTRAAATLAVTQSGMSRSLARLRDYFADPLFIRVGNQLLPTPRAESLRQPLEQILTQIDAMFGVREFIPAHSSGHIQLAVTSNFICSLMPDVLVNLAEQAPNLTLGLNGWNKDTLLGLAQNAPDLALGVAANAPADVYQRSLFADHLMCAVRQDHPLLAANGTLSRQQYQSGMHIELNMGHDMRQLMDQTLQASGLSRAIAMSVPQFWLAMEIASRSDLILTGPAHLLNWYKGALPLQLLALPMPARTFNYSVFWHARRQHDPAHIWLREVLCDSIRQKMSLSPALQPS